MNFDLSQLDKLGEGKSAKKETKFQPKFSAKPRAAPAAPSSTNAKIAAPAAPPIAPPAATEKKQARAPAPQRAAAAPTQPIIAPRSQSVSETVAPSAAFQSTRASKRPRKQSQPTPAAAETPGGLAIEPAAVALTTTTGRKNDALALQPNRRKAAAVAAASATDRTATGPSAVADPGYVPSLRPASPLSSRRKTKPPIAPKKRGRPRKNPESAELPSQVATAAMEEEEEAVGVEGGAEEPAPKLPPGTARRIQAQRVGYRRPTRRRRRGSDDDEEDDEEEDSPSSTESEEEEEDDGEAGPSRRVKKRGRPSSTHKKTKASKKPRISRGTKVAKIKKERKPSLADMELDPETMAIKDIVRWGNARDRRLLSLEKAEREKKVAEAALADAEAIAAASGREGGAGGGDDGALQSPGGPAAGTRPRGGGGGGSVLASPDAASQGAGHNGTALANPLRPANLAPQVEVIDGRVVVNRESLTVQAQERRQYTRIVTDDSTRLNSMTYMNRISNERWTVEDTELFYKALSQFGTDFTLISQLFPGRERRHLKNKYTRENKIHPGRVDEALRASANATINSYKDMILMLKESGVHVGAADGAGSQEAPAAPLAITEAGEPPAAE